MRTIVVGLVIAVSALSWAADPIPSAHLSNKQYAPSMPIATGWAGVWVRVDDDQGKALAFDDMRDRAVRSTTSFEWHSVVLEVPSEASVITMGVMLNGEGAVLIDELSFNAVDKGQITTVTDLLKPRLSASATVQRND